MKKFNFLIILRLMGFLLLLNGGFMFIDALVSYFYDDHTTTAIFMAGALTVSTALLLVFLTRNAKKDIKKNEGYLIVSLGWLVIALSGSLPFIFTGALPHFTDAFFESVSGYTTTGSTTFSDIEIQPQGILLWRSLTQWIGGMGIIVLAIAILPLLGIGGMQLFSAESPGPSIDKLHPKITDTAKRLWLLYIGMTFVETILLKISGMPIFDAINHSMTSVSCGGFSTKNASVAFWNNRPLIQYIIMAFMFISGTNFVLIYYGLKGKIKKIIENDEFRFYLSFILISSLIVSFTLFLFVSESPSDYNPMVLGRLESCIRNGFFQVLTVVTSTGFVTADFSSWTSFLSIFFFGLMFAGACSGSTSGGVKMLRHYLMIKNGWLELKRTLSPNAVIPVKFNKKHVSRDIIYKIMAFFIFYLLSFICGATILGFTGLDLETATSVTASSMGNIGPALGTYNPLANFSTMNDFGKIWCSFLMILGRLEILTILILFTPSYWRK